MPKTASLRPMGFHAVNLTTTVPGSTGDQDITSPLLLAVGAVPKAVKVQWTAGTAVGTSVTGARMGVGVCDGATSASASWYAENGTSGSDNCGGRQSSILIDNTAATSNAADGAATFVSFINGGVRINWSSLPGTAFVIVVTLYYGGNWTPKVAAITTNAVVNMTTAVTGMSIAPVGGEFFWHNSATATFSNIAFGAGAAANFSASIVQGAISHTQQNAAATSNCNAIVTNARIGVLIVPATGTVAASAELTSWDSGGITITTRDGSFSMYGFCLLFGLPTQRCWAGTKLVPSSSTGDKSFTDTGWRPAYLSAANSGHTALNTLSSGLVAGWFGMGAAGRVPVDYSVNFQAQDATLTPTHRCLTAAKISSLLLNSGLVDWSGDVTTYGSTGWTINVDDASGSDKYSVFLAIEKTAQRPPEFIPPHRRWRRQLARM